MENRLIIKLNNGKELVAELCNYDGSHPEIAICIQENGIATQDICLVRPCLNEDYDVDIENNDVECLVWEDEYDEDYTHKFVIKQFEEEEEL